MVIGPGYQPSNVYYRQPTLPAQLRRVAVLPMTIAKDDSQLEAGREALERIFWDELAKTKHFELVSVSTAQLRLWTGRPSWSAEERLPAGLFGRLKDETGCDAALFCQLTSYRAYPPLAVGWKLKLVDTAPSPIVWAADELFDAGNPAVANAARRYCQGQLRSDRPLADSHGILSSPRQFGQYSLNALLATFPAR